MVAALSRRQIPRQWKGYKGNTVPVLGAKSSGEEQQLGGVLWASSAPGSVPSTLSRSAGPQDFAI